MHKIRVWDLPLRLFHWFLALFITTSIITGLEGGNAMQYHYWSGYAILALLVFRLLWGFVGGHHARFTSFMRHPGTILAYVRGRLADDSWHEVGHNPLGSLSVLALLLAAALQVGSGLFANDQIFNAGPLANDVSDRTSAILTFYHTTIGQPLIYGLVGLHLAAILYYGLVRRKNLVAPMITGDKLVEVSVPMSRDSTATRLLAAVLLALGVALAWWVSTLGSVGGY